jgi:hypothetical protein
MMVVGDESAMSWGSVSYHQHKADLGWDHRMRFSDFLEELLAHDREKHCSVIASKEFRTVGLDHQRVLAVFGDGSSSIFLGKLASLRLLTCTPSRPHHHKSPSSIFEHRREPRIT